MRPGIQRDSRPSTAIAKAAEVRDANTRGRMSEARQRDRRWGLTAAKTLATIIAGPADSRRALEEQLGVSKASVCRVVDQLLERGLVVEGATLPGLGRGRFTTSLHARPDLGYVIGTDLEGLAIRVCVLDCARNILASRRCAIEANWSIQRILRSWRSLITETLEAARIDHNHVIALGVALPGMAATGDTELRTYLPPGRLVRFDVREELSQFDLPIVVSDNTLCVSDFERRLGEARETPSFLSILVRYGMGMTVSSRGRFIVGEELACGEFGHMRIQIDGPLCVCGLRGCLDAFCSGRTWSEANERLGEAWQVSIAERAQILGIGIGNLLKLVHSPLVILNGVYNDYQEIVREPLCTAIAAELAPLGLSAPHLAFGAPMEEKACIGAALRAVDQQMVDYLERLGTSAHSTRHTAAGGF